MAYVVAVFDDLLLGSNVLGMVRAAGHEAELVSAERAKPYGADVLIVDLGSGADLERLAADAPAAKRIGVYSHVQADQRQRALDAGFDLAVPRSRMAREGATLVARVLGLSE